MLTAVCSVKGSPGVTTFALALAARWPAGPECVVVEADPAGGDIGIRFDLPTTPGLVSLAAAARRDDDPRLLWRHTQALPGGLRVVVAPVAPEQTRAALSALGEAEVLRRAADRDSAVVVADAGRLEPGVPVPPIVAVADHTVVMVRAHTQDLAHAAARLATISRAARRTHLLLAGRGHTPGEVVRELGTPVLGVVPADRRGAAALGGHHPGVVRRGPSRSALGRAAARVARKLAATSPPGDGAVPVEASDQGDVDTDGSVRADGHRSGGRLA